MISPHVLILAAGQGKRMVSRLPKVLHPVLFRPMIHYVLDLAEEIPHGSVMTVVGHGENEVRESCQQYQTTFLVQKEQRGTGHAVRMAESALRGKPGRVLVLSGDVILLRARTLSQLLEVHERQAAACTLVSARLSNPHGYGRILRAPGHSVRAIREEADCSVEEKACSEVNAGIYCFEIEALFSALDGISNRNAQGEFYLTDAIGLLVSRGQKVAAIELEDPNEMTGINDRKALWQVESQLRTRINEEWMMKGVTMRDPATTFIDSRSVLQPDVTLEGDCHICDSKIGRDVIIESGCRVVASSLGDRVHLKQGSYIEKSQVSEEVTIGPYAHLRPGTHLERGVKIGNFVETKNSRMGEGSKASHLSYIGDAEVGRDVNLGCGFITCNYDGGPQKHKTTIGDGVFIGSDSQVVAPVTVGKQSYVASGSTITMDVPPGALAVGRSRQVNKPGYAAKLHERKGIK